MLEPWLQAWSSTIHESTVPLMTTSTGSSAVWCTFWVALQVSVPAEQGWGMPWSVLGPALWGAYLVYGELFF
jgi:hypothetical protein